MPSDLPAAKKHALTVRIVVHDGEEDYEVGSIGYPFVFTSPNMLFRKINCQSLGDFDKRACCYTLWASGGLNMQLFCAPDRRASIRSQVLAKFLGVLTFAPNWGVPASDVSSILREDPMAHIDRTVRSRMHVVLTIIDESRHCPK